MSRIKTLNKIFISVVSLIVIAYFVNVLANKYGCDYIKANPHIYFYSFLIFSIIYLLLHLGFLYSKIPEQDIISLRRVMGTLDKYLIEHIAHKYSCNIGFNIGISVMIENFINQYEHVDNQIYNKGLKKMLDLFATSLKGFFSRFSDNACVVNNKVIVYPELKIKDPVKYDNIIKELDNMGDVLYDDLSNLIKYCKLRGYSIY